jgi:uncharacterized protein YdhG (YjbR/CyaY superfamily)
MSDANAAATVDGYLDAVPEPARAALGKLRAAIRKAVPDAEEVINYGVPMFRLGGRNLVAYGAAKAHCSFFVQSPAVMGRFADDLARYPTSKGTIRFRPESPIPPALVKKIVMARIVENAAAAKARSKKS